MKKYFAAAALAATALISTPAAAHHGQEYNVSACGTDGNTAHMEITTVGVYTVDPLIQTTIEENFKALMQRHSTADHAAITNAYVQDLGAIFGTAVQNLVDNNGYDTIYLDFNHPRDTTPTTPGCAP